MGDARKILVTGAGSGFGNLTVRTLLEKGHTVVATMREPEGRHAGAAAELAAHAEATRGTLYVLAMDVTSDESVETAVEKALEAVETLDVVVNNAGYGIGGFTEACTVKQVKRIFDVNLLGCHRVNRAVLPSMRAKGSGLLVHISSVMGRIVIPFAGPYTASKYAVEGYAEGLRYELSGAGVDVVIVEPGGFGTGFMAHMDAAEDEKRLESYGELAEIPEQMWGGVAQMLQGDDAPNPQDVADAVAGLIEMPPGSRPLRTVVDPMSGGEGPTAINQATDKIQEGLLKSFGMGELLKVKG